MIDYEPVMLPHGRVGVEAFDCVTGRTVAVAEVGRGETVAEVGARLCELQLVTKRNSGGMWHAWYGSDDGTVAHHATGGHATEELARQATRVARLLVKVR